jgi:hypothetical protein
VAFKEVPDMESARRKTRRQQREFWHSHVVEWSRSGLSLKEYTSNFGLEYSSFCRWRRFFEREPGLLPSLTQVSKLSAHKPTCGRKKNSPLHAPQVGTLSAHAPAPISSKPAVIPFGSIQFAADKASFLLNRQDRYRLEIPSDFEQDALARLLDCLEAHL